jgi:hypothetical protein
MDLREAIQELNEANPGAGPVKQAVKALDKAMQQIGNAEHKLRSRGKDMNDEKNAKAIGAYAYKVEVIRNQLDSMLRDLK